MEFLELLQTGRPVLLDGGMGTMLQAKGLPVGATPELTALEHPEWLLDIHGAYVEAGSQILYANKKQPANIPQAVNFNRYSISALTSYPPLKITSISVLLSTLTHSISFRISTLSKVSNSKFSCSIISIILSSLS